MAGVYRLIASITLAFLFLISSAAHAAPAPENRRTAAGTIVCVGDSLTAGLGVGESNAYPARLSRKLAEAGYHFNVVNAGISGETSSGTLSRVNWVLKLKPDIVLLETGANDGMRGIDPAVTRRNIDKTIRILKKNKVVVVLVGMRMFVSMGREFSASFAALYPDLAGKHGLILVPFLLQGVAGDPSLNQPDGIHPTAEGYRIVANTVYPYARSAIDRFRQHNKDIDSR